MKPLLALAVIIFSSGFVHALLINPMVDTDRSVNTYSVETMVKDVVNDTMTGPEKLDALYTFHRRMMHHYRLAQSTEDGTTGFDLVKLYTVYGSAWCTQTACVFNTLCAEAFGWNNTEGTAGSGWIPSQAANGGHSSFHLRFDSSDTWHWVDPIIGGYARNRTNGAIASFEEITADPTILTMAEAEGRASMPYFACTKGTDPLADTPGVAPAFSYFEYDTAFMIDFAAAWSHNQYTNQPALFTLGKQMQKGESYQWYWDFLPGDYFNMQALDQGPVDSMGRYSRDWRFYPPRHLCGWKDSLDANNWPYFKPYKKVIKGDTCYRYYANGVHVFEPTLASTDPKDRPYFNNNVAFHADDGLMPALRPAGADSFSEIAFHVKLPYPLMDLKLSCDYTRKDTDDTMWVSISKLRFRYNDMGFDADSYLVWLSTVAPVQIKTFDVSDNGTFDTLLRDFVDPPMNTNKTYQGYIIRIAMKAKGATTDVGLNRLRVECIFQHNMFALPQFEPGVNNVTVTSDSSSSFWADPLQLSFSWQDNGQTRTDTRTILSSPTTYPITVNQSAVPKMLSMKMANLSADSIVIEKGLPALVDRPLAVECAPNPFTARTRISLNRELGVGGSVKIFDLSGKLVKSLEPARRSLSWDAGKLPAGIYLVKAVAGKKMAVKRVVLVR